MSFRAVFDKQRQVIPRWHTYALARWLGVTVSGKYEFSRTVFDEDYRERVRSWENSGKLVHAADLVGNALVLNCFEDKAAIKAAEFILQNKDQVTKPLLEIVENFLRLTKKEPFPLPDVIIPEESQKFYRAISSLKARTKDYPRNPILWMDLAFYYSAIGQTDAAERAVMVSLSLNKENRYLLRSGSRFFIHIEKPDAALDFLRRSNIGRHDPWLVAAEIAISDTLRAPSKRIKTAKRMVESSSIPKFHLSELASALGTMELSHGSRKKGKKLFALALEEPTENTLAQATFMQDLIGGTKDMIRPEQLTQAFEAQARLEFQNHDFVKSFDATKKWFAYEPFSSRPAVWGSYIASVGLGQFEDAIKLAKMGLLSSPNEFMLRNNLVFSMASLGDISGARESLGLIAEAGLDESDRYVLAATRGLIEFRSGNIEEGRRLYKSASEFFRKQRDYYSEAIATHFWAREEKLVKSPHAKPLEEATLEMAKKFNIKELISRKK